MQRAHLLTGCAAALALSGLLAACDDGPTQPSPQPSPNPGPVPVTTTRIEIRGPDTIAPGTTAQFSAIAYQSDSSTRDVTSEVEWRSGNHWVLTISATGLATAHDRGEAGIGAAFAGRTSWKSNVMVIPPGTYRLIGTVSDAGLVVSGARVEVTSGTGQGLFTLSSARYLLYGVAGEIEVRVTLDGYEEQRKRLHVGGHQVLDFDLTLSRPRSEVSGTYTLSVTAAAECRADLPEAARSRTYTALVSQDGPRLTVVLDGSQFIAAGARTFNTFGGVVQPHRVTFQLNGYFQHAFYLYLPDVLEQLTAPMLFSVSGSVDATASAGGVAGTLAGDIETLQPGVPPVLYQQTASCRSTNHQFVLSR
jgi:hypothetical protein